MINRIAFILLSFLSLCGYSQDYFMTTYSHHTAVTNRSFIANTLDDGIIEATQLDSRAILVKRLNKCGVELWAKEYKHPTEALSVDDVKLDQLGNIIFSGEIGTPISPSNNFIVPYIFSLKLNGDVNFFKAFNFSISVDALHYSLAINDSNEYLIYFNHNTSGSGPVARVSIVKIDTSGFPLWVKSYEKVNNWGRAIATKDGGLLFRSGSALTRVDSRGNIVWSKYYTSLSYIDYPVEIDGGFIMFRYPTGAVQTINVLKIAHDGEIKWISKDFTNFSPKRGILRKNGNVLFTGSANGVGLVEMDTSDGSIVQFKTINPNSATGLTGIDLFENEDEDVFVTGLDASGILSTNVYLRLNNNLELPNCVSTPLSISTAQANVSFHSNTNATVINRTNRFLSLLDEPYLESNVPSSPPATSCNFVIPRGNLKLGNDTILCPKQSITLGDATTEFDTYLWSEGQTSKTITANKAGIYWLEVTSACETFRDSIKVSYFPSIGLELGEDTSICTGDSVELGIGLNFNNYQWSTGESTKTISVKKPGIYWLDVQTNCGTVRDSITVSNTKPLPPINLGKDIIACPSDSILIGDPNSTFNSYSWNTGDTTKTISINFSGLYILTASSTCESFTDSIAVGIYAVNYTPFIINKKRLRTGDVFTVKDTNINSMKQKWDFGDGSTGRGWRAKHSYSKPGTYTVSLSTNTGEGCLYSSFKNIVIKASKYHIPTVFTPNNDGINDLFYPIGNDITSYTIRIYNRWGALILETNHAWDGRGKDGTRIKEGTYLYEFTLNFNDGSSQINEGNLTLIR